MQSSIPLDRYIMICLYINQIKDVKVVSSIGLLQMSIKEQNFM